jgi:hypothetical protein
LLSLENDGIVTSGFKKSFNEDMQMEVYDEPVGFYRSMVLPTENPHEIIMFGGSETKLRGSRGGKMVKITFTF